MPIPVILLTGHLGAGKTTTLNHLLGLSAMVGRRPALIINEFGRLGIDGQLIRPGPWERFELNKGSLFCVCLKTDFLATLRTLADRVKPGVVLVEATGVADPCDLEQLIDQPHLSGQFAVESGLCLIDAPTFIPVAAFMRTAQWQAVWADALVINKCDLVTPDALKQLHAVLSELNPEASRIEVEHGRIPLSFLQSCRHRPHRVQPVTTPPASVVSISLTPAGIWDADDFNEVIAILTPHLLRLKGWADFGQGIQFVEWGGGGLSKTQPPFNGKAGRAGIVVIAWKTSEPWLHDQFERAGLQTTRR